MIQLDLSAWRTQFAPEIVGDAPQILEALETIRHVAATDCSVLITGETGTGKELFARAAHRASPRRNRALIPVNCAAIPENLLETELFGHIKGAFTGATNPRTGRFMSAHEGTIFLDEIGDLPLTVQSKLLRALQEQAVRPVGGTTEVQVDLRVVAATHHDLDRLVEAGRFRDDLLARLGGSFALPALRERREDLGLIIGALLARIEDPRAHRAQLSGAALGAILRYPWPRNVRELHNALARAIALAGDEMIELDHLPPEVRQTSAPTTAPAPPRRVLSAEDQDRRARLIELLQTHRGNVAAVAREFGTVRSQIQRWMKRYGLERVEASCGPPR